MRQFLSLAAALVGLLASPMALAQDGGMFAVRVRAGNLSPANSDASNMALSINKKSTTEVDLSVFLNANEALELAILSPQNHTLYSAAWAENVGSFKQTPITLVGQHHFTGLVGDVRPYLGLGLTYTRISGVSTTDGVLDFKRSSLGLAAQIGLDVPLAKGWLLNLDVKKLQIATRVSYEGTDLGKFKLDPVLLSVGVGVRF
ncbi:MAG: OmpW family protein [Burkholderiales bacterium]|nr:OmpW family protein [Burkholderiales bacterium]